ncbi:hypothetical protein MP638_005351 [Amoeboaphelidium occidentale]|nr:hypothetical protein MP638_005351 [Amoeboaphelidium occidentale]
MRRNIPVISSLEHSLDAASYFTPSSRHSFHSSEISFSSLSRESVNTPPPPPPPFLPPTDMPLPSPPSQQDYLLFQEISKWACKKSRDELYSVLADVAKKHGKWFMEGSKGTPARDSKTSFDIIDTNTNAGDPEMTEDSDYFTDANSDSEVLKDDHVEHVDGPTVSMLKQRITKSPFLRASKFESLKITTNTTVNGKAAVEIMLDDLPPLPPPACPLLEQCVAPLEKLQFSEQFGLTDDIETLANNKCSVCYNSEICLLGKMEVLLDEKLEFPLVAQFIPLIYDSCRNSVRIGYEFIPVMLLSTAGYSERDHQIYFKVSCIRTGIQGICSLTQIKRNKDLEERHSDASNVDTQWETIQECQNKLSSVLNSTPFS